MADKRHSTSRSTVPAAPITTTFTVTAPALDGAPEPEVRLRRFLKRIARDYGIAVKWAEPHAATSAEPPVFSCFDDEGAQ